MKYLKVTIEKGDPLHGEVLLANLYLSKLTTIESKAQYGDVSFYADYADYKDDLQNWREWYRPHRCEIKECELVSLEADIKESTTWIEPSM